MENFLLELRFETGLSLRACSGTRAKSKLLTNLAALLCCLTTFAAIGNIAKAQGFDPSGPDTEIFPKTYGSFNYNQIDSVNLENGQLNLSIPIFSYPQRGALTLGFTLKYQSLSAFSMHGTCTDRDCAGDDPSYGIAGGMYLFPDFIIDADNPSRHYGPVVGGQGSMSLDGTGHQYYNCSNTVYSGQQVYIDSSGVVSDLNCSTQAQTITDPNGNQITSGNGPGGLYGWIDTMGRFISYPFQTWQPGDLTWSVPGIDGGTATYTFARTSIDPNVPSMCTGIYCFDTSNAIMPGILGGSGNYNVQPGPFGIPANTSGTQNTGPLSSFTLPDGSSYQFTWDNDTGSGDHYGDLAQVTLPTGGTISYTWVNFPSLWATPSPQPVTTCRTTNFGISWSRALASRTVNPNDGSPAQTWLYAIVPVNTSGGITTAASVGSTDLSVQGSPYAMVVTDPAGNHTVHVFQGVNGSCSYYEIDTEVYAGAISSSNLLSQSQTAYYANPGQELYSILDEVWPTSTTSPLQQITYDSYVNGPVLTAPNSVTDTTHFNEPTSVTVQDLVTGKTLNTTTSYLWQANSAYQTANILHSVTQTTLSEISGGTTTQVASTKYFYDETSTVAAGTFTQPLVSPPMGVRGNLTSAEAWRNATNDFTPPVKTSWYSSGMPYQTFDMFNTAVATVTYGYEGAYPIEVDNTLGQPAKAKYDFNTGLQRSVIDANGNTTWYKYYTSGIYQMGRLEHVDTPVGRTSFTYPDAVTTQIVSPIDTNATATVQSIKDGLGRKIKREVLNVPTPGCTGGTIYQVTTYDFADRVAAQTRPYCSLSDPTYDVKDFAYDALGRILFWGWQNDSHNGDSYTYPAPNVQQDFTAAPNEFDRTFDASGRIIKVMEPSGLDDPRNQSSPSVETDYKYDALGNLASVKQYGDPQLSTPSYSDDTNERIFQYNSLSQLTSASNPETGVVTYNYDTNGNLQNSTDARGITTLICYDISGRPVSRSTIDTSCSTTAPHPDVTLTYDTSTGSFVQENIVGQLTGVKAYSYDPVTLAQSETSEENYSYTNMGNQKAIYEFLKSEIGGAPHTTLLTYNAGGDIKTITYPSTRVVTYNWDTANHLMSVQDTTGNTSGVTYYSAQSNADGSPSQTSIVNGIVTSYITRDNQSRPTEVAVYSGASKVVDKQIAYDQHYPGMLSSVTDALHASSNYYMSYDYDPLSRLADFYSNTPGGQYSQVYSYTSSGNLIQNNNWGGGPLTMPGSAPTLSFTGQDNKSHNTSPCAAIPGVIGPDLNPANAEYDLSGNRLCDSVTAWGMMSNYQYLYSKDGRLSQVYQGGAGLPSAVYTYSGEGNRVRKESPISSLFQEYVWVGGNVLAEHLSSGWIDYIYANGQKVAKIDSSDTHYYLTDSVGTTKAELSSSGSLVWQADFSPFGQQLSQTSSSTNYIFTGQERDVESQQDNFNARYYSSAAGRFSSPDPSGLAFADLANPQSLNLYTYVLNNPLNLVDPSGLDPCGDIYESEECADQYGKHDSSPSTATSVLFPCFVDPGCGGGNGRKSGGGGNGDGSDDGAIGDGFSSSNLGGTGIRRSSNRIDELFRGANLELNNTAQGLSNQITGVFGEKPIPTVPINGRWAQFGGGVAVVGLFFLPGPDEAEGLRLSNKWSPGTFESVADSLEYHFQKHGAEVSADSLLQYLRKADAFAGNLERANKKTLPDGSIRYMKAGRYLIRDIEGLIVSFGKIAQ